jgi:signal peptidase
MRKVLKYSGAVLVALMMLLAVAVLFAPRFGWQIDVVMSSSMSPAMRAGGVVVTKPIAPDTIKLSDVIAYHSPLDGKLVTHRVVGIQEHSPLYFQTKGDANEDPDPYLVPSENIVGKVRFYIPLLGYMTHFAKTPLGFILMLGIPGLIIIGLEMKNIWNELSEEERRKKAEVAQQC